MYHTCRPPGVHRAPPEFRNTKKSDKIIATGGSEFPVAGWGLVWVWALRQKHGHRGSTGGSTAPKRVSGAPGGA